YLVLCSFDEEEPLQLAEFFRELFGQVFRLAPVLFRVIEFPNVVLERWGFLADEQPRRLMPSDRGPALVIDAPVPEHLEVLRLVALRRISVIERVHHAHAFDWMLLHSVHVGRLRNSRRL